MDPTVAYGPKKHFPLLVVILILVLIAVGGFIYLKKPLINTLPMASSLSPNILYLTSPITDFSGKIEDVRGNTLTVSSVTALIQSPLSTPSSSSSFIPQTQTKTLTYKIVIPPDAQIVIPPSTIPYLFKVATPSAAIKGSLTDLKIGENITATSKVDLRTLQGDQFEASIITVNKTNHLSGTITGLGNGSISVKSADPSPKDYTLALDPNAEVVKISTRLSISDLKEGMRVSVFTDSDINSSSAKVLKVDVAAP